MKKGFILTECFVSVAFMAVFLPLLAVRFGDDLRAAIELRRSHEARAFAAASLNVPSCSMNRARPDSSGSGGRRP